MSSVVRLGASVLPAGVLRLTGVHVGDAGGLPTDDPIWPDGFPADGTSGGWHVPGLADAPGFFQIGVGLMVVLFVVVLGLVITLAVHARRREKVRLTAVQAWALGGGWTVSGRDDRWASAFSGSPFGRGDNRRADDVCTRTVEGLQQVAFTYRFETTSTSTTTDANGVTSTSTSTTVHPFTVAARQLPAPLGPVRIDRETLGQKVARAFGGQDVEVELAEFNRRYRVTATDPKHALDLLSPRTVERLLVHRDASLQVRDGWAVSTAPGAMQPDTAQERLAVLDDLLRGVPPFVWQERGWSGRGLGATLGR